MPMGAADSFNVCSSGSVERIVAAKVQGNTCIRALYDICSTRRSCGACLGESGAGAWRRG